MLSFFIIFLGVSLDAARVFKTAGVERERKTGREVIRRWVRRAALGPARSLGTQVFTFLFFPEVLMTIGTTTGF